jgi:predicted thioesterase
MACNNNCNQGRDCDCGRDRSVDRATVVVATLLLICILSICLGLVKLYNGNKGQDCAVEVQFQDSKATYIGKTV